MPGGGVNSAHVIGFPQTFWTQAQEELLVFWAHKATHLAVMHASAATQYEKRDRRLGLPAVFLAGLTGSGTLAAIGWEEPNIWVQAAFGFLMLISAGLTAMHNFLSYVTVAERHRQSRNNYEAMRAEFEVELACPLELRRDAKECIDSFKDKFTEMARACPITPGVLIRECTARIEATKLRRRPSFLPPARAELRSAVGSTAASVEEATHCVGLQVVVSDTVEEEKEEEDGKHAEETKEEKEQDVQKRFEREMQLRRIRDALRKKEAVRVRDNYTLARNLASSNDDTRFTFLASTPVSYTRQASLEVRPVNSELKL